MEGGRTWPDVKHFLGEEPAQRGKLLEFRVLGFGVLGCRGLGFRVSRVQGFGV